MPTTTTLDFQATWTDIYGSTYDQKIQLHPTLPGAWPNQIADQLSAHLAWVCEHHAIASYSITSI